MHNKKGQPINAPNPSPQEDDLEEMEEYDSDLLPPEIHAAIEKQYRDYLLEELKNSSGPNCGYEDIPDEDIPF